MQAAIGNTGSTVGAVTAENTFAHIRDITVADLDMQWESGTTVLTQELTGTVDDTVIDQPGTVVIGLQELVSGIITFNVVGGYRCTISRIFNGHRIFTHV